MTHLDEWAARWAIPLDALADLKRRLHGDTTDQPSAATNGHSETHVQSAIRLEASRAGCRLWRNNVGAAVDAQGRHIRYGLCNESKKMNEHIKSSDLIGIRPVVITPDMVGRTIGQFVAREVKRSGWKYRGDDREEAQRRFIELVVSLGGDACFTSGEGTL